ncbi:MAG: YifB family Mg chelatase-like AAA ATPase, partial [Spirochaetaceae bacterium]|nr:YifB family Mg chelatase-like AAA ATPase [Spirochaetaceae bacterium]
MQIYSFSPFGYEGALVRVEVDLCRGIPAVDMVGLPDGTVRESRERMRAAIRNSALEFPAERILINLSPADVKKEGSGFDLPIALAILAAPGTSRSAANGVPRNIPDGDGFRVLIMGELELSGSVRGVRGISAAISTGIEQGIRTFIIPRDIAETVELPDRDDREPIRIIGVETLQEAFSCLLRTAAGEELSEQERSITGRRRNMEEEPEFEDLCRENDYTDLRGQPRLVRALQIAAAGGHHLFAFGPPGCGKTLALERFWTLLPLLKEQEAHTVTRIHSLTAGDHASGVIRSPPFRQPHQNASLEGMIGGGPQCRPGEISLAHHGVLFLDEAAEFRHSVLQSLRIPLETGQAVISRAGRTTCFPARFQLLLAANPCACGNFGADSKICVCSPQSVEQYWKRFS